MLTDFRERGREGVGEETDRQTFIDRLPPTHTPTGDRTCNPGMRPDWESNLLPLAVWDDAPTK